MGNWATETGTAQSQKYRQDLKRGIAAGWIFLWPRAHTFRTVAAGKE